MKLLTFVLWSYDKCWEGYTHVLLIFKVQDAIAFSLQNQQGRGHTSCTIAAALKQENNALQARQMFTGIQQCMQKPSLEFLKLLESGAKTC